MPERTFYVISNDKCLFEGMTKEQVLTAIANAIETGSIGEIDTGFITTVREINHNIGLKFWVGTTAEYNALPDRERSERNVLFIKTDDAASSDFEAAITQLRHDIREIRGGRTMQLITDWNNATEAGHYYSLAGALNCPPSISPSLYFYGSVTKYDGYNIIQRICNLGSIHGLYYYRQQDLEGHFGEWIEMSNQEVTIEGRTIRVAYCGTEETIDAIENIPEQAAVEALESRVAALEAVISGGN